MPAKAPSKQVEDQVDEAPIEDQADDVEEAPVEEPAAEAYSDLTKEKKSAYIAALKREIEGYEARVKQLKAVNEDDKAKVIEGRVKQVEAELKRVSRTKAVESTVDEEA